MALHSIDISEFPPISIAQRILLQKFPIDLNVEFCCFLFEAYIIFDVLDEVEPAVEVEGVLEDSLSQSLLFALLLSLEGVCKVRS